MRFYFFLTWASVPRLTKVFESRFSMRQKHPSACRAEMCWEWDWSYITLSLQGITPANGKTTASLSFCPAASRLTAQKRFTFAKLTEKYNISCPSWLLSDLLRHLGHQLRKDEGQVPVKELNLFSRVFRVIWMKNHKLKMATYYIGNIVQHVYTYIYILCVCII